MPKLNLRTARRIKVASGEVLHLKGQGFGWSLWTPAALFQNGEQGAWYDPSDLSTLFQDAAGTVPVLSDGDPVGLMLDASQGLVRGPELFTGQVPSVQNSGGSDGAYDPATRTLTGNLTDGPGTFPRTQFDLGLEAGKVYEIDLTFSGDVDSVQSVRIGFSSSAILPRVAPGRVQGVFTADDHRVIVFSSSALPFSVTFDSISVRELPGNHASQAVAASRPVYRTDGTLHWLEEDGVDDALVSPLPDLGTNATLAYANAVGVTILEGQTISGDTALPQEAELYGAVYLDRPFTASETTQVTNYLNKRRGA